MLLITGRTIQKCRCRVEHCEDAKGVKEVNERNCLTEESDNFLKLRWEEGGRRWKKITRSNAL
jgi:hypothetical protein